MSEKIAVRILGLVGEISEFSEADGCGVKLSSTSRAPIMSTLCCDGTFAAACCSSLSQLLNWMINEITLEHNKKQTQTCDMLVIQRSSNDRMVAPRQEASKLVSCPTRAPPSPLTSSSFYHAAHNSLLHICKGQGCHATHFRHVHKPAMLRVQCCCPPVPALLHRWAIVGLAQKLVAL